VAHEIFLWVWCDSQVNLSLRPPVLVYIKRMEEGEKIFCVTSFIDNPLEQKTWKHTNSIKCNLMTCVELELCYCFRFFENRSSKSIQIQEKYFVGLPKLTTLAKVCASSNLVFDSNLTSGVYYSSFCTYLGSISSTFYARVFCTNFSTKPKRN